VYSEVKEQVHCTEIVVVLSADAEAEPRIRAEAIKNFFIGNSFATKEIK
jgi:hypothetical protein